MSPSPASLSPAGKSKRRKSDVVHLVDHTVVLPSEMPISSLITLAMKQIFHAVCAMLAMDDIASLHTVHHASTSTSASFGSTSGSLSVTEKVATGMHDMATVTTVAADELRCEELATALLTEALTGLSTSLTTNPDVAGASVAAKEMGSSLSSDATRTGVINACLLDKLAEHQPQV
jgi:hypothetical protein